MLCAISYISKIFTAIFYSDQTVPGNMTFYDDVIVFFSGIPTCSFTQIAVMWLFLNFFFQLFIYPCEFLVRLGILIFCPFDHEWLISDSYFHFKMFSLVRQIVRLLIYFQQPNIRIHVFEPNVDKSNATWKLCHLTVYIRYFRDSNKLSR